jgi:hypothetical protein
MKKTYIAPLSTSIRIHAEGMMACSGDTKSAAISNDDYINSEDQFATKRGGAWSSSAWSNED